MTAKRDHGGDLDRAMATYGGAPKDWLDLSTGINPMPYPLPAIPDRAWATLPTGAEIAGLVSAARAAYRTGAEVVPLAGAQAAIQLVPRLDQVGEARVLGPTYNEHAAALRAAGWQVTQVARTEDLAGAALAVVVNPNNPDGRRHTPDALLALAGRVGRLVVDESFGDVVPDASLGPHLTDQSTGVLVLRSFGKFYGLAGLRLGFALCGAREAQALREMAGPWAVNGPAIAVGTQALRDAAWADETRARLQADTTRLDALALAAGWELVGGCTLFRTYEVGDALAVQARLARAHVWSRAFPYTPGWLRLGLPPTDRWAQIEAALAP